MTRNAPPGPVPGLHHIAHATDAGDTALRHLLGFAAVAVAGGGSLLALSTVVEPGGVFLLAAVYLTLALPALLLTYREQGGPGVRRLLRDCARIPHAIWWLPVAGFALPTLTWTVATPLGGARPITAGFAVSYLIDLLVTLLLVNLWEEMAWAGYFQRRAMSRWGQISGSLVTAGFFTAIHVPLALSGVDSLAEAGRNLAFLIGVAVGVRVVIARLDQWTGSLLVIGLFHASFNATEEVLRSSHDWVRVAIVVAVGLVVAAAGHTQRQGGTTWD